MVAWWWSEYSSTSHARTHQRALHYKRYTQYTALYICAAVAQSHVCVSERLSCKEWPMCTRGSIMTDEGRRLRVYVCGLPKPGPASTTLQAASQEFVCARMCYICAAASIIYCTGFVLYGRASLIMRCFSSYIPQTPCRFHSCLFKCLSM